jgi:hypothetical protein
MRRLCEPRDIVIAELFEMHIHCTTDGHLADNERFKFIAPIEKVGSPSRTRTCDHSINSRE